MLGEALCGSTGQTGGYQTAACAIVDPFRHWVIQSQCKRVQLSCLFGKRRCVKASSKEAAADFFGVLNHSGVPDPSGVSWTGHAVTGETVPVFPGETVVTNFTQMTNGSWLLQFSVENELPDRGETMSSLQIDHPCKPTILDFACRPIVEQKESRLLRYESRSGLATRRLQSHSRRRLQRGVQPTAQAWRRGPPAGHDD